MSGRTLLLLGGDACFTRMLRYELNRAGYCVIAEDAPHIPADCALVDLDSTIPPEDLPFVGYTRGEARTDGTARVLTRPFAVAALLDALSRTLQEAPAAAQPTLRCVGEDHSARYGRARLPLMPAEYALLEALLAARGEPVSRADLAAALPSGRQPASNLLEVTICSLRRKLEENFGLRPIRTVRGIGWRLDRN